MTTLTLSLTSIMLAMQNDQLSKVILLNMLQEMTGDVTKYKKLAVLYRENKTAHSISETLSSCDVYHHLKLNHLYFIKYPFNLCLPHSPLTLKIHLNK